MCFIIKVKFLVILPNFLPSSIFLHNISCFIPYILCPWSFISWSWKYPGKWVNVIKMEPICMRTIFKNPLDHWWCAYAGFKDVWQIFAMVSVDKVVKCLWAIAFALSTFCRKGFFTLEFLYVKMTFKGNSVSYIIQLLTHIVNINIQLNGIEETVLMQEGLLIIAFIN